MPVIRSVSCLAAWVPRPPSSRPGSRRLRRTQQLPCCSPAMQLCTIWAPTAANSSSCPAPGPSTRSKEATKGSCPGLPGSASTTARSCATDTQARAAAPPAASSRALSGRTRTYTRMASAAGAAALGPPLLQASSYRDSAGRAASSPSQLSARLAPAPARGEHGSLWMPPGARAARRGRRGPPARMLRLRAGVRLLPGVPAQPPGVPATDGRTWMAGSNERWCARISAADEGCVWIWTHRAARLLLHHKKYLSRIKPGAGTHPSLAPPSRLDNCR